MTDNIEKTRPAFEAAVIERLKESGFLEIEIRVDCLKPRVGDGYQDEVINAGWHYWKAALSRSVAMEPISSNMETQDQVASILLQFGSDKQKAEALTYVSHRPVAERLPQDVINLVIAAREACDSWQLAECEFKKLDHALDAFSERVPYENEPEALPVSTGASE